ncbi:MAG: ABC transporter ATP-binding protein [Eubacteriales bacterium]|nr:ABC transporter ATP-binding protein [Eubacteriales bacterium]
MFLEINDLHVHYGGIKAVRGITMDIREKQIVTLIGANGAGKSSTLRAIMGMEAKAKGQVIFKGEDISNLPAREIVKRKVAMSPEGRHIFPELTVRENLILGAYTIKDKDKIEKGIKLAYELFPILGERSWQKAGTLSGGEQQMLAVARALMIEPELLILDEPSLGLAPIIVQDIFNIIRQLHDMGNTILLIEQNAKKALSVADYAYVLESGVITLEGPGQELLENPQVRKAYLGE